MFFQRSALDQKSFLLIGHMDSAALHISNRFFFYTMTRLLNKAYSNVGGNLRNVGMFVLHLIFLNVTSNLEAEFARARSLATTAILIFKFH